MNDSNPFKHIVVRGPVFPVAENVVIAPLKVIAVGFDV